MKFLGSFTRNISFTRGDKNGIVVVCFLIISVIVFFKVLISLGKDRTLNEMDPEYKSRLLAIMEEMEENQGDIKPDQVPNELLPKRELTYFNPNSATREELLNLGFPSQVASNLVKYVESGGRINKPADLLKIYGMQETFYHEIKPFVKGLKDKNEIDTSTLAYPKFEKREGFPVFSKVELNSAGIQELKELYGIGDVLGERIMKYRELLGGFYREDQLGEVYGIDQELFESLVGQIAVDSMLISKININKASESELIRHPYIDKYMAGSIIAYRDFKKQVNSLVELLENKILDKDQYLKIAPYLTCQ